jgi:hypothetical protein
MAASSAAFALPAAADASTVAPTSTEIEPSGPTTSRLDDPNRAYATVGSSRAYSPATAVRPASSA